MTLIQFIYSNLFLYSNKVDRNNINLVFIFNFRAYAHLLVISLFGYIIDMLSIEELVGAKISFKIGIYDREDNYLYNIYFIYLIRSIDLYLATHFSDQLKDCLASTNIPFKELEYTHIEIDIEFHNKNIY